MPRWPAGFGFPTWTAHGVVEVRPKQPKLVASRQSCQRVHVCSSKLLKIWVIIWLNQWISFFPHVWIMTASDGEISRGCYTETGVRSALKRRSSASAACCQMGWKEQEPKEVWFESKKVLISHIHPYPGF